MSTALSDRLQALAEVLELGEGRLDPDLLDRAAQVSARAGARLRLSSKHTVVALAGATGSGKSSLHNALVGSDVSTVGVRRPTTAYASAAIWGADGSGPLLDWLGVPNRHVLDEVSALELPGLVLLDLPDHDSTAITHRLEVDRLVEMVDLLVWVVDPQKYADAALHERYLRRLASHDAVVVIVLNQVDRLEAEQIESCLADLHRLLAQDGLADATVVAVSALTQVGLDELRGRLSDAVRRRAAVTARLEADLDRLAEELAAESGLASASEPPRLSRRERSRLSDALANAAGVPEIGAAVGASYALGAVGATGWPFTRWLRGLRPDPLRRLHLGGGGSSAGRTSLPTPAPAVRSQVDSAIRGVVDATSTGLPQWEIEAVRRAAGSNGPDLADSLDRAVGGAEVGYGRKPFWWLALGALQYLLAAMVVVGLVWLAVLFGIAWLQLPKPPTADVRGFDLPTLLLVGGLVGGLLVALLGRILARSGARRRRRRAEAMLLDRVDEVAESKVLGPVREELAAYRNLRDRLAVLRSH